MLLSTVEVPKGHIGQKGLGNKIDDLNDVDMMPKLNKHSLNNSTICEALPFPMLWFVRHVVIVSILFPYPKCHDVKLGVILFPSLVNFNLHPSLAN